MVHRYHATNAFRPPARGDGIAHRLSKMRVHSANLLLNQPYGSVLQLR